MISTTYKILSMMLLGKSNMYTDRAWQMALIEEGLRLRPNQPNLHQVFGDFSRWFNWYYRRKRHKAQTPPSLLLLPGASLSLWNICRSLWQADVLLTLWQGPLRLTEGNESSLCICLRTNGDSSVVVCTHVCFHISMISSFPSQPAKCNN